ncbi:MAG: ABC transporter substrate binding protein [Acidobacteriota bacterium]
MNSRLSAHWRPPGLFGLRTPARLASAFSIVVAILLATGALTARAVEAQQEETDLRIGVLLDGDWPLVDEFLQLIRQELALLTDTEFSVEFARSLNAEWNLPTLYEGFDELLDDPQVDLVLAPGLAGSQLATSRTTGYEKPVVAALAADAEFQNLPRAGRGSGVPNLVYVALADGLDRELEVFGNIAPFEKLALVSNREFLSTAAGSVAQTNQRQDGVELRFFAADRTAESVLEQLPEDVDAVYLWPLVMDPGELRELLVGLNERKLPTFSAIGRDQMEAGALATIASDELLQRLGRRIALVIHRILLGEEPAEIPVTFTQPEQLIINAETMRLIDASPRFEMLLEAEMINTDDPTISQLDLTGAVQRAVAANRNLVAEGAGVEAGVAVVRSARARLGPQASASLSGAVVDSETAANSFGNQPQQTVDGSVSLSQILYSNEAFGALAIERFVQEGREAAFERARLDTALDTANAYINLLRAQNLLTVQRDNLSITRANLELAEARREVGVASSSEILRWESEVANAKQRLIGTDADVRTALIELNRLMHMPEESTWVLEDLSLDNATLLPEQGRFRSYIETPRQFETVREFAVTQALERAPELAELDRAIDAQSRALTIARRAYWLPDVGAQAQISDRLDESGAGSELPSPNDDSTWSVGVSATLSLFEGGARNARVAEALAELDRLERSREATAEFVEQAVRNSMLAARASFANVTFAGEAFDAARQSRELVQEAYARGAVNILSLLDAQNASLQAETAATDAVYDFFVSLMNVQRSINQFDFFVDETARAEWFDRLDAFFAERGVERWVTE